MPACPHPLPDPADDGDSVITSYSIHYTKLYDVMTHAAQEICTAQACGTTADNSDFLAGVGRTGNGQPFAGIHLVVRHKTLELVDGDRFVLDAPTAVILAGMGADTATGEQQRIAFSDGVHRAGEITAADLAAHGIQISA